MSTTHPTCKGGSAPLTPAPRCRLLGYVVPAGGMVFKKSHFLANARGRKDMEKAEEQKRGQYPCIVRCRVSIETQEKLVKAAEVAGMSIGRYARHRLDGSHVSSKMDAQVLNELRRIGGLLKLLATEGQPTGPALSELMRTMKTLQTQ